MNILGNSVSKAGALKAMGSPLSREIEIKFADFSVTCQVDLSVMQQNFLVDAVFDKVGEIAKINKSPWYPRSVVTLRSLFEWIYTLGWTDVRDVLGLVDEESGEPHDLTDRKAHNLARELNLVEVLSETDPKAKKMFDVIWQAILHRADLHDKLLAANLANDKINAVIEKAEQMFSSLTETS